MKLFNEKYKDFLLKLLGIPTISPFEINAYDPDLTQNKEALDAPNASLPELHCHKSVTSSDPVTASLR